MIEFLIRYQAFLIFALVVSTVCFGLVRALRLGNPAGAFVAEAWLEWEVCTGSTLYRARFNQKWQAAIAAKLHAVWLDWVLPVGYTAEYSSGKRYTERYGFDIRFGVRNAVENSGDSQRIWSPFMPGTKRSCGEHASCHPLSSSLQGTLAGYKI